MPIITWFNIAINSKQNYPQFDLYIWSIIQQISWLQFVKIRYILNRFKTMALWTITKYLLFVIIACTLMLYILFNPHKATQLSHNAETIRITRDSYAIPFIQAPSRTSYYYAYGWLLAQDRPFQMAFRKLIVEGRLAQFLGEIALPMDKFMREMDLKGWGNRMAERLRRENISEYKQIQFYAQGMNDCMASLKTLPIDFHLAGIPWQNWTVNDVMKMYKLLELSVSVSAFDQLFRSSLLVNYTKEQIDEIFPTKKQHWAFESKTVYNDADIPEHLRSSYLKMKKEAEANIKPEVLQTLKQVQTLDLVRNGEGSNSWAIAGKYTESGKPILGADPHLGSSIPSQWYPHRGCYYNNNKKYCFSLFGVPGTIIRTGKTDYMAIGVTIIYNDCLDFYKEKVENDKYLVDGEWRQLKLRTEAIKIKTDKGLEQIQHVVRQTHRGPVVNYYLSQTANFQIQQDLSLQWGGAYDDFNGFIENTYLPQYNTMQDLLDLGKNKMTKMISSNMVMITVDGHIASQRFGVFVLRKNPEMANYVKDGTTTEDDWLGFMPNQHRLSVVDPECGYIVAANNRGASHEYYNNILKFDIFTARADRITEMIEDKISRGIKFNAQVTKQMIEDTVDTYCQRILPTLIKVVPQSAQFLKDFDCDFSQQSTQATIYEVLFYQLHQLTQLGEYQKVNKIHNHVYYQFFYNYIKKAQKIQQNRVVLRTAWNNLLKNPLLSFQQGKQTKRWGEIHRDVMVHAPFGRVNFLSDIYNRVFQGRGNLNTVNVAKMAKVEYGNYDVSHRATNRGIFSFQGPNYWVIDSGVDERFFSKHYDDQWKLFKDNKYIRMQQTYNSSSQSQL